MSESSDVIRSRRHFLKASSAAALLSATSARLAHGAGTSDLTIRIGLIGCGGRGTGAVFDAMGAATKVIYPQIGYHTEDVAEGAKIERPNVSVVALADLFEDRLDHCRRQVRRLGMDIPPEKCHLGFDAYQKVVSDPEVNYVILATPPHFRPRQLMAAIQAGKHVFMEKPVAVDGPGVREVLAAGESAAQKNLGIAAGTQRRHMPSYRETIRRVKDGEIGEVMYGKCYWNGGQIWVVDRKSEFSDMEWQIRNWNYFTWLSGDHYVEQHVHNLDVMNWVIGAHPLRAVSGVGGRQVRTAERYGNIYDHFAVEYEYPGGITMFSQARQINGCKSMVEEEIIGTKGRSNCEDEIRSAAGERWRYRERHPSPYRLEHEHLIQSIGGGKPINEAKTIAEATLTGIIGREAAYSGQPVTWEQGIQSNVRLGPTEYAFGDYTPRGVRMPGTHKFG